MENRSRTGESIGIAAWLCDNDAADRRPHRRLARAGGGVARLGPEQPGVRQAKLPFEQGRLAGLTDTAAARYRQATPFTHPEIDAGPTLRRVGLVP